MSAEENYHWSETRLPGFYWIRDGKRWEVAEWISANEGWKMMGVEVFYPFDEIIEEPLAIPGTNYVPYP